MMRLAKRSFFCHTACIPVVAKKFSSFSNLWWVKSATELFTNPHWVAKMGRRRLFCCKAASWLHVEKAPFPNKMSPKMPSPFPKEIYGLLNWGVINHWPHDPLWGPLFLGHPREGPDELKKSQEGCSAEDAELWQAEISPWEICRMTDGGLAQWTASW